VFANVGPSGSGLGINDLAWVDQTGVGTARHAAGVTALPAERMVRNDRAEARGLWTRPARVGTELHIGSGQLASSCVLIRATDRI
jgi:hypothetical protein